ncbi:MAG: FliI/YscN family ATPase [Pseudomonadota bacterium]
MFNQWLQADIPAPVPIITGHVTKLVGILIEVSGIQCSVGTLCRIKNFNNSIDAEVVGFNSTSTFLMPLTPYNGMMPGAEVIPTDQTRQFPIGNGLLTRVLDGYGITVDDKGPLQNVKWSIPMRQALNPLHRDPINTQLDVGVRVINGLIPVGRGQRLGLFAGSGVGKSVLLGMMTRFTQADVVVVGLIGERGREVKEFIEEILGEAGRKKAIIIAAPADAPALARLNGADYATSIAEHFRNQGKHVLLLMDSLTRYAQAQRELAIALGEPAANKGYPPSVFTKISQLIERTGNGILGCGSITAFYTVLVEGDDLQDPVADSARAILDGHIVLARKIADQGIYPAIDVGASVSRVVNRISPAEKMSLIRKFKRWLAIYEDNFDLVQMGAYQPGTNPELDLALQKHPKLIQYVEQSIQQQVNLVDADKQLQQLCAGN